MTDQQTPHSICDYSDFDYQSQYWGIVDRQYEDLCDRNTLIKLLNRIPAPIKTVLDAGCGYGRLFSSYSAYGESFYLMDYAMNLLSQLNDRIFDGTIDLKPVTLVRGNLYELPFQSSCIDLVISIRTLHHLNDPAAFFKEVNRVLMLHGHFILEIPNKAHLLNRIRFLLGRMRESPFSKKPLFKSDTYVNYHPEYILNLLKRHGLFPVKVINTSLFRSALLKRLFSKTVLYRIETILRPIASVFHLAPSVFVLCENRGIAQSG